MPTAAALLLSAALTPTLVLSAAPPEPMAPRAARAPAAAALAAGPVATLPTPDLWTDPPEPPARYEAESGCDPVIKPGTAALRDEVLQPVFGGPVSDFGTSRSCSAANSGHEEGRAIDWMVDARVPAEAADARRFLDWLLASDGKGNAHAQARRLGIMYVLYDNRTWAAYRPGDGWRPQTYGGRNCETLDGSYATRCHRDHMHISLSWAGAGKQTSYWRAPAGVRPGTLRAYPGTPLRVPSRGDAVLRFERRLAALGLLRTRYVDGYLGGATEGSTRVFQSQAGLPADGVVGPQTWETADATGAPDRHFAEDAAANPEPAVSP